MAHLKDWFTPTVGLRYAALHHLSTRRTYIPPIASKSDATPNEYNQCVFIRYYTMRRRVLMFPKVIKAAAGPHHPGSGSNY
jgi:hypothetical protein